MLVLVRVKGVDRLINLSIRESPEVLFRKTTASELAVEVMV